jgi:hypothetical protein
MRITIGGVLLMAAVAGAGYYGVGRVDFKDGLPDQIEELKSKVASLIGFYQGGDVVIPDAIDQELAEEEVSPPLDTEAVTTRGDIPSETDKTIQVGTASKEETAPKPSAKTVTQKPAQKKSVKTAKKKTSRKSSKKGKVVFGKKKSTAKKPAPQVAQKTTSKGAQKKYEESLIGSYVTLTLNNGRKVKGILEGKTPIEYKVELPGLGTFPYAVEKVKSITLAE